ncbi:histone RNA hairpin-binding protein [Euwallacea fornicatus]|uniref:histone RNA hairpin-binding protein n=1 Tax=Euwallacea fornicatus TaxID=995702 RepID=UPI00338F12DF
MDSVHKLTMNTSLKNARIFDDDEWDDSGDFPVRKNKQVSGSLDTKHNSSFNNSSLLLNSIKEEPDTDNSFIEELKHQIKEETDCKIYSPKWEIKENNSSSEDEFKSYETSCNIKSEQSSPVSAQSIMPHTPPPPVISGEDSIDRMFDESPYNRELFESCKIKDVTPIKIENDGKTGDNSHGNQSWSSMRSAKRTVFTRPSPYKTNDSERGGKKVSIMSRLGPKVDKQEKNSVSGIQKKMPRQCSNSEMESDPIVLQRRQKQIEYGKNTIGYDNFTKMVPRSERKLDDPKTPPKYGKYSRRAWEGLIKQWRIKLHKYDPPEAKYDPSETS